MPNKVMVVEDEQILAQNLQVYLEFQQMEVQLAHDGANAIKLAEQFEPDVVVLDFRLPDMEGFQVFDAICQRRDCTFVLMTGHPTSQVRDGAEQRGIRHILFKPFPLVELAKTVRQLLEGSETTYQFVERRRNGAASFPLQLYEGTWVATDRRRAPREASDDEEPPVHAGPPSGS